MRRHRGLVAAVAGAFALVVLPAEAAPAQGSLLVTIVDATPGRCSVKTTAPSCYSPASVTVAAGTEIEWYNRSSLAHSVTGTGSTSGWGSGTINSGATYSHTFDAPGTYDYHCIFHAGMTGVVYVYDANGSTTSFSNSTGSGGTTSFSISSPQTQPFTSTSTSSASSSSTAAATAATTTDTTDGGDQAAVVNGFDASSDSSGSHSSAPAAVLKPGGGSGPSAVLVAVLLLLLIGGSSTAALVLTRPGRAARR